MNFLYIFSLLCSLLLLSEINCLTKQEKKAEQDGEIGISNKIETESQAPEVKAKRTEEEEETTTITILKEKNDDESRVENQGNRGNKKCPSITCTPPPTDSICESNSEMNVMAPLIGPLSDCCPFWLCSKDNTIFAHFGMSGVNLKALYQGRYQLSQPILNGNTGFGINVPSFPQPSNFPQSAPFEPPRPGINWPGSQRNYGNNNQMGFNSALPPLMQFAPFQNPYYNGGWVRGRREAHGIRAPNTGRQGLPVGMRQLSPQQQGQNFY